MEGMSLKLTPVVMRHLLGGSLSMFGPMLALFGLIATVVQTVLTEGLAYLQLPTFSYHPPCTCPPPHPI